MSRPKTYATPRSSTGVRLPPEMLAALHDAAAERGLSVNYLIVKAVEEFLDRLIPVGELRLTRDRPEPPCPECGVPPRALHLTTCVFHPERAASGSSGERQ